jgi:hypothetical protein
VLRQVGESSWLQQIWTYSGDDWSVAVSGTRGVFATADADYNERVLGTRGAAPTRSAKVDFPAPGVSATVGGDVNVVVVAVAGS